MKCTTCKGNGYILTEKVPDPYKKLTCYDCDGTGDLNPPTGNHCPACGEPIPLDKKWCDFHKTAEQIQKEMNP